ncbi:calcineurin-like phosphoesterase family protein [Alteromonadaceae bacterium 2753L.S.0a.02]|nr:calcineurin-like phosphoesterase family protein [Alteromonadaceae bacterium 2753L.S.0a.02]
MNRYKSLTFASCGLALSCLAVGAHASLGEAATKLSDTAFLKPGKFFFQGEYEASVEVIPSDNGEMTRDYVEGKVFLDKNRNGRLDRGEQGIPGVMVSNGVDVVITNRRGEYKLPAKAGGLNDFTVFITKPAAYDVPVNTDNVPQFFYHHMPAGSPEMRFGGMPATGAQPAAINFPMIRGNYKKHFKVAISGDPQPYSNNEVGYVRDALANELAMRNDLEFVLVEGDIMGDDLGLYPRFKKILSAAGIPMYFVPGNHDLDADAPSDKNSFDTFKREWGPTYYSFETGDVHFVVLDNVRYPCTPEDNTDGKHGFCENPETSPTYNGVIDEAQMEWLANDLQHVAPYKLIVLNMHIPLVSFVDMGSPKHQTDNTQALYDLLGDRPALALSGHTHTLETFLPGESFKGWNDALGLGASPIPQIITGATSGSWWSGDLSEYNLPMSIQRLGAPRGYLIFEFFGNNFSATFKAANKAAEEQMSVDFLSPTFLTWYEAMRDWAETPAAARSEVPPVNINDLPDTSILTSEDLAGGTQLMINVWNGSRDSRVWVQIDDQAPLMATRTQQGEGEAAQTTLDPFALKKQMYVFRYAAKSESGNERTQGFEMFNGARLGTADPQPLEGWIWTRASNHIWAIDIPADIEDGVHTARIITRDVYGKVYKSSITFEVMDERPAPFFRSEVFE